MNLEDTFICTWFKKLCNDLRAMEHPVPWFDRGNAGNLLLEVLLDASNELCVSSFLATHLRRFGRDQNCRRTDRWFWVRSEWAKFDLSYGLAFCKFEEWNAAWVVGDTGDLGTIELKVIYDHYDRGTKLKKMDELYRQLVSRRGEIAKSRSKEGDNLQRQLADPAFHGLVIFLSEKGTEIPDVIANASELLRVAEWEAVAETSHTEMETLWPCKEMWKTWELRFGLLQLKPNS